MVENWIKELEKGSIVIVCNYHSGDRIETVKGITPTGRIVVGEYTFNQKGRACGKIAGIRLKEATSDNIFGVHSKQNMRAATSFARDIGNGTAKLTYAQAQFLLSLNTPLVIKRFTVPVSLFVTYQEKGTDNRKIEPLYSYPLCSEYLKCINMAIRTLPATRYEYGGLVCGIHTPNLEMTFFLSHVIDYILPFVEVRDGVLTGVFEVGSRQVLCHDTVIALQEYLETQCFQYWGEDMLQVKIPVPDAVLYYENGSLRFCSSREAEQEAATNLLIAPAVRVQFYNGHESIIME